MFTKAFWVQALERAARTFAQTAIAAVGVGTTNLFSADLKNILALSVSAAVLSLLMSVDRSTNTTVIERPVPVDVYASEPHTNMRG